MKKESSKLLLPDVNVLLALAWPNHQFHDAASRRLESFDGEWATCALTELGFIRLSSNPSVVGVSRSPMEVAKLLAVMTADAKHVYLNLMPSPVFRPFLDAWELIMGSKQVTDVYLLMLARANHATLMTFDARMPSIYHSAEVEVLG
jgi:hypothetical protein